MQNDKAIAKTGPGATPPKAMSAAGHDGVARYRQEVEGIMFMARSFPRDCARAQDAIQAACCRVDLAEVSAYQYSRGGTDIYGPSIRLMEAIAQQWGNLTYGLRELSQTGHESIVEAFAWDVESNVRASRTFTIKHVRYTREGSYTIEDSRDVYELVANNGQRRVRACLQAVIPRDIVDAAMQQCERTLTEKRPVTPENIKKLIEAFAAYGVTREMLEHRVQRRLDSVTSQHLVALGRVLTSIKDGMASPRDFFALPAPAAPAAATDAAPSGNAAKALAAARKRKPAPEPAPEPAPPSAPVPAPVPPIEGREPGDDDDMDDPDLFFGQPR